MTENSEKQAIGETLLEVTFALIGLGYVSMAILLALSTAGFPYIAFSLCVDECSDGQLTFLYWFYVCTLLLAATLAAFAFSEVKRKRVWVLPLLLVMPGVYWAAALELWDNAV